jgi:hypothetical protein
MGRPSVSSLFEVIKHEPRKEELMRIKLNRDWNGAVDGIHVALYPAGSTVDFPIAIAQVLLEDGRATLPDEAKAIMGAPENKMMGRSPENKAGGRKRSS